MNIDLGWTGIDEIQKLARDLQPILDEQTKNALKGASKLLHQDYQQLVPKVSGQLADKWGEQGPMKQGDGWVIQMGPTAPYARRYEIGHRKGEGRGRHASKPNNSFAAAYQKWLPRIVGVFAAEYNPARLKRR